MPIISGGGSVSSSGQIADGIIQDVDVASNAAIDEDKIGFNTNDGSRHDHDAADIVSGTLPPARGGAGTASQQDQRVGVGYNSLVKLWFNIQLIFKLWTGSTSGALTTDFLNWERSDATDVYVAPMGTMVDFQSAGSAYIWLRDFFRYSAGTQLAFNTNKTVVLDWWAKMEASSTGAVNMGLMSDGISDAYTDTTYDRAAFARAPGGTLYARTGNAGVGQDLTDVSSGITLTNWNNYRIELTPGTDAKYYINGVLVATHSGANLPDGNADIGVAFCRDNTALFQITAPNLAIAMT